MPGLVVQGLETDGFRFDGNEASGISAAKFYWDKIIIEPVSTGTHLGPFAEACGKFWGIVRDGLGVGKIYRMGNRYGYFFSGDVHPKDMLSGISVWQPSASTADFGKPSSDGIALRFENPAADRRIRVEIVQVETNIRNAEKVGIILDIDFTTLADAALDVDVAEFVRANQRFIKTHLHQLLR